jgi:hypothetical protein
VPFVPLCMTVGGMLEKEAIGRMEGGCRRRRVCVHDEKDQRLPIEGEGKGVEVRVEGEAGEA